MWAEVGKLEGERALEFAVAAIDPICNIAKDDAAADIFYGHELPEGTDAEEFLIKCLRKSIPMLIKKHKDDLIAIICANQGITPEEYASGEVIMLKLAADITQMISDASFRSFFAFAQPRRKRHGSAQQNTKA